MRTHYQIPPPAKKRPRWAMKRGRVRKYVQNGVTYYFHRMGDRTNPVSLTAAVKRVLFTERLSEPERVWTVQGSWEVPLAQQLREQFPELPFDADVERESRGLVFAVDMKSLRAIEAEVDAAKARMLKERRKRRSGDARDPS
jgi:hypothetical protein